MRGSRSQSGSFCDNAGRPRAERARRGILQLFAAAAAACVASGARAQSPYQSPNTPTGLRPVEATIGDVGPLRMSLRELRADLRMPTSFETVYRFPAGSLTAPYSGIRRVGSPDGAGEERLARVNGAVIAVFPRSIYNWTGSGPAADVPPGTVYLIGTPAGQVDLAAAPARRPVDMTFVDTAASSMVRLDLENGDRTRRPNRDASHALNVFVDDDYRQQRVAELLTRAALNR